MMTTSYLPKKKSCPSESSTPSSPSPMAASYMHNNNLPQNGVVITNGNAPVAAQNGQNASESPSPGINNNNAPKYGTPVPNRIFVGGISAQTTESELAQLFSAYGNVKATKIIVDRAGVSKGYGFVTFETELEARRIMRDAQCVVFKQRKLNIAPAIKKQEYVVSSAIASIGRPDLSSQPFSRSLEVQSPPIGIPSTVLYANGSPYMFHNGMAFFSPPEPTPNFPPAPANSQMATVPAPAAVCPTMMYPCPPGQPLYQYPYQHVPSHMFRNGQPPMGYVFATAPVVNQDHATAPASTPVVYYSVDGQLMQLCEPPLDAPVYLPLCPVPNRRSISEIDDAGERDRIANGPGPVEKHTSPLLVFPTTPGVAVKQQFVL